MKEMDKPHFQELNEIPASTKHIIRREHNLYIFHDIRIVETFNSLVYSTKAQGMACEVKFQHLSIDKLLHNIYVITLKREAQNKLKRLHSVNKPSRHFTAYIRSFGQVLWSYVGEVLALDYVTQAHSKFPIGDHA